MSESFLGFGLGLRTEHFTDILEYSQSPSTKPNIDWFEIISENFMVSGGKPKYYLHAIREQYPMVMHGVSLSIGSSDPLDQDYLKKLKVLANEVQPHWFSDHLCWTGVNHTNTHDLLPLPYDDGVIQYVGDRIRQVQDQIGIPFLIENVSSYLSYKQSTMSEWEFVNAVVDYADCYILLDINNIFVSAKNHGFDPYDFLKSIDPKRVKQIHLAGHSDYGDYIIDTHDAPIVEGVWELYQAALVQFGAISTMIERDDNIPPLNELVSELDIARKIANTTLNLPQ